MVLIILQTMEFTSIDEAETFISNTMLDENEIVDLFQLNYRFAVQQVDERVGQVMAQQISYNQSYGETSTTRLIEMVDCRELESNEEWSLFFADRGV